MNESQKAVFLSYASQDAEVARRLCDSLRQAGVEVWFDQSELRGGDAWDQNIRKQIKDCALFVPIISAATQARTEGYFRLEWRLADQRTHLMAKGRPFLLPVVIDGTRDAEAHVPDSFTEVQWTRLPGGETPAAFCERVRKLLGGGTVGGTSCPDNGGRSMESGRKAPPATTRGPRPMLVSAIIGFAAVVVALAFWQPWRAGPPASAGASGARSSPRPDSSEARQLAARARKHFQGIFTRADLALAEELGRRAAELEPTLARAWAVRAGANACYLMRGFVAGEAAQQRARDVQAFAAQALALDRDETEALIALGQLAMFQNAPSQAEALYRRVIAKEPENPFARRYLSIVLRTTGRVAEAIESMQDAVRRFPHDTLTHFDLAVAYAYGWNWPRAWEEADAALALEPFPGALMLKVRLAFQWKGEVGLMRELLDKVDVTYRGEDDAVVWEMRWALWSRQPERVLEAAGSTARPYLEESFIFPVPKTWFTAQAYELAGKSGLARQQWQIAESVLRERIKVDPQNLDLRLKLAVTLARMGENEQATRELQPIESAWREQINADRAWDLASFYAAGGDAARAVPLLREALHAGSGIAPLTVNHLKLDPWWDKIRRAPEFLALLANAPPPPSPVGATSASVGRPAGSRVPAANEKSVAVLAFKNLSDDKGSEYFSDGLSEELSNVLGRVPGLRVAGSTSAFSFKGKAVTLPEIARQLGVAYLVEGSVQREGSDVRITAKLINGADGLQVWTSGNLKRKVESSLALQEEIAGLIAKALSLKLGVASPAATTEVNPQAFELYLQGRQAWNLRNEEGYARAEQLLNRALEIDPNFARAHAALADVWNNRGQDAGMVGTFGQRNSPEQARIDAKVRQALALDPESAEARASLGVTLGGGWKFGEAEREFRRAIALNPNYASAHQWLGRLLVREGRMDEALGELKLAADIDPLSSRILDNYGSALIRAGRHSEAMAVLERALVLQPNSAQALYRKAIALLGLGRFGEAIALARQLPAGSPNTRSDQLRIFGLAGLKAEAEALLSAVDPRSFYPKSHLLLTLGRLEEAIAALDASTISVNYLDDLLFDPVVDPIRGAPRFKQFLATLGVTEAHARAQAWRAAHAPERVNAKK